jgi:hypothetical protein
MNVGVKRLAIVLGCAGAAAHLVLITVLVPDFEQSLAIYAKIGINTLLCFFIPFGVVYGSAWVVQGFKRPLKTSSKLVSNQTVGRTGGPPSGSNTP